jgi:hypothetical protein
VVKSDAIKAEEWEYYEGSDIWSVELVQEMDRIRWTEMNERRKLKISPKKKN